MSIKFKISFFTLLLLSFCSYGQLTIDWVKSTGNTDSDLGFDIVVDSNDNVFMAGQFRGTVNFDANSNDTTFTAGQFGDVFLQKFDENGNFLWVKVFQSDETNEKPMIVLDDNDDVYLTSTFNGTIDLDPGMNQDIHTSPGGFDNTYIVKLNNNGDYLWGNAFENISSNQFIKPHEIAIDKTGNVLLAGEFQSTVDFDYSSNSNLNTTVSGPDGFLLKIDSTGNFIWVKQFSGGVASFYISCIAFDSQNSIILGGAFKGSAVTDFDPGPGVFTMSTPNINDLDLFILKLSFDGNFIWAKKAEGYSNATNTTTTNDNVSSIVVDRSDNLIFTGVFEKEVNFDPNSTSFILDSGNDYCATCSYETGFLATMDPNGDMIWAKMMEGDNNSSLNIFNGSSTASVLDFNENQQLYFGYAFFGDLLYEIDGTQQTYSGASHWDIMFFQINPTNGDYISSHVISNNFSVLLGGMVFKGNDLYATGTYLDELYFDSNTSITAIDNPNSLFLEAFTVKYNNATSLSNVEFEENTTILYPNPTKNILNIQSKLPLEHFTMYDINGRILMSQPLTNSQTEYQVDTSNLSQGIYFVKIQTDLGIQTEKIIKE